MTPESRPRLKCLLCGLIVMEDRVVERDASGHEYDYWEESGYIAYKGCPANSGAEHIDPEYMTGVQIEAVLEVRRKWFNP